MGRFLGGTLKQLKRVLEIIDAKIGVNRIIFIIIIIGAAYLNRFRSGYISSMLFNVVILIPISDGILVLYTYSFIRYNSKVNKRTIIKGNNVEFSLDIVNDTHFMFCPFKLSYLSSHLLFSNDIFNDDEIFYLFPNQRKTVNKKLNCQYRGNYNIGIEKITIVGFFKLISLPIRNIECHKILVYPQIYNLTPHQFKQTSTESVSSKGKTDLINKDVFSDIRSYRPGDSLAKVHWKLTARKDKLMTKEYEGNNSDQCKMIINNSVLPLGLEQRIIIEDYVIEGAVSISKYFLDSFNHIDLLWFDLEKVNIVEGHKKKDFGTFYNELAKVDFIHKPNMIYKTIDVATKSNSHYMLIVITSEIDEKLCQTLISKKKLGHEIIVVIFESNNVIFKAYANKVNRNPLYALTANGVEVHKFVYEEGMCRLDVIS